MEILHRPIISELHPMLSMKHFHTLARLEKLQYGIDYIISGDRTVIRLTVKCNEAINWLHRCCWQREPREMTVAERGVW
jgi:hypothetical protein